MNKVILIASILFPLIFFTKKKIKFNKLNIKILFIFIFLASWLLKNILVSGCFLYPLKVTCLDNLKWSNIEKTEHVSSVSEAWAKGWSDFRKKKCKSYSIRIFKQFFLVKILGKKPFFDNLKNINSIHSISSFCNAYFKKRKNKF